MKITAKMVSELRARTGAGIMDCKKALIQSNGDLEAAIQYLREKGLKAAELRSARAASEGLIVSCIHPGNRIGSLVELNCETDFVARTEQFQQLAKDIAMQVAASKPKYIRQVDVPEVALESEKAILRKQAMDEGKPEQIADKIVEGRLSKFYSEVCLLEQPYIRDTDKTVKQLLQEAIAQLGENIVVKRVTLYVLGQSELRSARAASEGLIVSYIHPGNRIGSLVELNCETDFVARTEQFQQLAKDIAMQVAASKPKYIRQVDVPEVALESEKAILRKQAMDEGKPEQIADKIVEGRLSKFYSEVCLLEQPYIRDTDKTVKQLLQEAIAQLGENIVVKRVTLYVLGQSE